MKLDTTAGKARWRYCLIGAIIVLLISIPIEHLNVSRFLKDLVEMVSAIVVAVYFYGNYYRNFIERERIIKEIVVEIGRKMSSEKKTALEAVEEVLEGDLDEEGVAIKKAILDLIAEGKEIEPIGAHNYDYNLIINPRIAKDIIKKVERVTPKLKR